MHPELFTLPILGITIKTYGFCLMVGFLSAVWLGMRRAERTGANPDVVLDISFLALVFGVGGARVFYVVHYWEEQFAGVSNRFVAVIDITQGGLEFLGGFLCAMAAAGVYALWKKVSLRQYLDILAPSCMWGLAFGRLGCFFNGCCFGGMCVAPGVAPGADQVPPPYAVTFPFASPAQWRQWENREATLPAELIVTAKNMMQPFPLPGDLLAMPVEKRERATRELERLQESFAQAQRSEDAEAAIELKAAMDAARQRKKDEDAKLVALRRAQSFPSRVEPGRRTSVTELEQLASQHGSHPVHPTQLYSSIHALLLSMFLTALLRYRRRHGVVIGALIVMYPIPRVVLELIRVDNPHDVAGLTVSQFVSLGMLVLGVVYLVLLFKRMPEQSPRATFETADST